jgi:biotin synthase
MTPAEALQIVALVKSYLPTQRIMIAGGRELVFGDNFIPLLEAGAHAIVIGNYLTTVGAAINKDREILTQAGYEIVLKCES